MATYGQKKPLLMLAEIIQYILCSITVRIYVFEILKCPISLLKYSPRMTCQLTLFYHILFRAQMILQIKDSQEMVPHSVVVITLDI